MSHGRILEPVAASNVAPGQMDAWTPRRPALVLALAAAPTTTATPRGYGHFLEPAISRANVRPRDFDCWIHGRPFPLLLRTAAFSQASFPVGFPVATTTVHTASFNYWHRRLPFPLIVSLPRRLELSYADLVVPSDERKLEIAQAFLTVPSQSRQAQLSYTDLTVPNDPAAANKMAELSYVDLTVPDPSRRAQLSFAQLAVPDQIPGVQGKLDLAWVEFSVPTPGRRAILSWARFVVPDQPRAVDLSYADLSVPEFDRSLQLSFARLVVPVQGGLGAFLGSGPTQAALVSPIYGVQMTTSADEFKIKQGDTLPRLRALAVVGGNTVTLAAGDAVKFHMADTEGAPKINAAATRFTSTQIDSATGLPYNIEYEWLPADTEIAGEFRGEFEITFADGSVLTVPNDDEGFRLKIVRQLA